MLISYRRLFILLILLFLFSCSNNSDQNNLQPSNGNKNESKPTIRITNPAPKVNLIGDNVQFKVVANSGSNQVRVRRIKMIVQRKQQSGSYSKLPSYTITKRFNSIKAGGNFEFQIKARKVDSYDSLLVQFIAENSEQLNASKTYRMVVGKVMRDKLSQTLEKDFIQINHNSTPRRPPEYQLDLSYSDNGNSIGYLIDGEGKKADIQDNSKYDITFGREWTSETSTKFVKANNSSLNFSSPVDLRVRNAFYAGNGTSTVENIREGDLIIAKIRWWEKFILIRINNVHINKTQINKSYIRFNAKGVEVF